MNEVRYFIWLCRQANEFLSWPPVLAGLTVSGIIIAGLCVRLRPIKTRLWRGTYWLVFTQILFYPPVLTIAALYANDLPRIHEPNKVASACVDILSWTSLVLAGFWIWYMKGLRWLALSLVMFQELLMFGAFVVAEMAISGDWL